MAIAVLLVGCGTSSDSLPAACTNGPSPVVKALAKAPGPVMIDGTTRISDCFTRGSSSDDVQIVGTSLLAAAQRLGDRARAGDAKATLQLGYLIGATQRGARSSGVADELVRRLQAETDVPASGRAPYARGRRAGLAQG